MEWPEKRGGHAATCVSGPILVIMGGVVDSETISDCWIYDFTTMLWKKVLVSETCLLYFVRLLVATLHVGMTQNQDGSYTQSTQLQWDSLLGQYYHSLINS